ncbi:hypothetical protein BN2537_5863 [Streptomyces venezuelae]|nr:hypothetical protein BN2537_5863 [Streptomyces venezuelae]
MRGVVAVVASPAETDPGSPYTCREHPLSETHAVRNTRCPQHPKFATPAV